MTESKKGFAVTILSLETESDLKKEAPDRIIIAIFSYEHNAKFYVEKTYKNMAFLKPEIVPVVWMAIRDR
jgi:hypothetical protein